MTEYDYSPAAWQAHLAKQAQIDTWREHNAKFEPVNPFMPTSTERESEFYKKSSSSKHKDKKKGKKSKRRGYYSEGEDSDASDYGGPDRPPTPPASAPVGYGYGGAVGYPFGFTQYAQPNVYGNPTLPRGYPQQHQQQPQQLQHHQQVPQPPYRLLNNQTGQPLLPVWTGGAWLYQNQQAQAPAMNIQSSRSSSHRTGGSGTKHRKKRSLPASLPLGMSGVAGVAMGPGAPVYSAGVGMGGSPYAMMPQQGVTTPPMSMPIQQQARGPYSASLPAMSGMYLPSGQTSPASGVYSSLPGSAMYPMSVPQVMGGGMQSPGMYGVPSGVVSGSSTMSMRSYPVGTVIVDGDRHGHGRERRKESSGSSFFGRLTRRR